MERIKLLLALTWDELYNMTGKGPSYTISSQLVPSFMLPQNEGSLDFKMLQPSQTSNESFLCSINVTPMGRPNQCLDKKKIRSTGVLFRQNHC